ncbi:MAG TPA: glycosyltransferase family 39 protein [Anaerolineales bacterium]|nr:glycosyltransferase family 39 protein [Anaerolineales bacterium]
MTQTLQTPTPPSLKNAVPAKQSNAAVKLLSKRRLEWLTLGLIVIAALVIRVYQLGTFPDTFLADEADNGQDAVRILYGQHPVNGFFGLDWTSQPAFSIYKEAGFIALFGFNIAAMRLPSALISALALIPFYIVLRRRFTAAASLFATVLLATNVWYLNFSRSGWNCIDISFYMLMTMLCLMRALDATTSSPGSSRTKWIYFAAAGFFCALGLYGYPSGRAITLAVAAFLPVALLYYRQHFKTVLLGFALLFAVEAVVFAPQGIYVLRNWERFNGRTNVVSILNSPEYQADPTGTLLSQLKKNIRGPWDGEVNNTPQYSPVGEPLLDPFTGSLAALGIILTVVLASLRKTPETWLWWLMLLSGWLLIQVLTRSTPNGARGVGYVPVFIYFAGAGLDGIVQFIKYVSAKAIKPAGWANTASRLVVTFLAGVVLFMGTSNVKHYVDWQNEPRTREARYLYVTAREFPQWSAAIIEQAKTHAGIINVGQWRETHPIENRGNPYGVP